MNLDLKIESGTTVGVPKDEGVTGTDPVLENNPYINPRVLVENSVCSGSDKEGLQSMCENVRGMGFKQIEKEPRTQVCNNATGIILRSDPKFALDPMMLSRGLYYN